MAHPRAEINPGDRFGHLVVEEELPREEKWGQKHRMMLLICDCGNKTVKTVHALRVDRVRSCSYQCPYRFADRDRRSNKYA